MRYVLLCLLALPSCIGAQLAETEGRVLTALEDQREATLDAYVAYTDGAISQDELEDTVEELRDERDQTVAEAWAELSDHVEAEVERVGSVARGAAGGLLGGGTMIDLLAAVAASVAGGTVLTNRVRDRRRTLRGEPVNESKPG